MLFALQSLGHQKLLGIVESDETFFLESDKGKKEFTYRNFENEKVLHLKEAYLKSRYV